MHVTFKRKLESTSLQAIGSRKMADSRNLLEIYEGKQEWVALKRTIEYRFDSVGFKMMTHKPLFSPPLWIEVVSAPRYPQDPK